MRIYVLLRFTLLIKTRLKDRFEFEILASRWWSVPPN